MDQTKALGKQGSLECAEFKVSIRLTFPGCDKCTEIVGLPCQI